MAFGRRKKDASVPDDATQPDATQPDEMAEPDVVATSAARRPLDESEVGEGSAATEGAAAVEGAESTMPRLDLGSLRIPVLPDIEVRVELDPQQQPIAASVLHAGSAVQVLAFAAPRGDGIWDDVRAEIAESVRADGGTAEEIAGPFGTELRARVRAEAQPGQVVEQHLRFVGFDGPRWFVRGVFSGPAATNPQQAGVLESILTSVVVVRGTDPMAPRDPLPLQLPRDVAGMPQPGQPGAEPAEQPSIDRLQRGPEITETR